MTHKTQDAQEAAVNWEVPNSWGDEPPPLCGHTLSIVNRKAYLIGGCGPVDGGTDVFDHIYSLDLATWKWTKLRHQQLGPQACKTRMNAHARVGCVWVLQTWRPEWSVASKPLTLWPLQADMVGRHTEMKSILGYLGKTEMSHQEKYLATRQMEDLGRQGPGGAESPGKHRDAEMSQNAVDMPAAPTARWKHSACVIGLNHVLVFGGIGPDEESTRLGDTWILDLTVPENRDCDANLSPGLVQSSGHTSPDFSHAPEAPSAENEEWWGGSNASEPSPEGPDSQVHPSEDHLHDAGEHRPIWIRPKVDAKSGPSPRSHHTAVCHTSVCGDKVWIFGGYGGDRQARTHLNDLFCLQSPSERTKLWAIDELLQWQRPEVNGASPGARSGHTANIAQTNMIIAGGRDHNGPLADAHVFSFDTYTWSTLKAGLLQQIDGSSVAIENQAMSAQQEDQSDPMLPMKVCNHLAQALESVPSYKFFLFGGQTCGKLENERGHWRYCSEMNIMDGASQRWSLNAAVNGRCVPQSREDSAWAYDQKTAQLVLFGGWSDDWLGDLYSLNVSGIVGPPYAVQSIDPTGGPTTGNTLVRISGINFDFRPGDQVKVHFGRGENVKVVDGELISGHRIHVRTPSWEDIGADEVEVRVSLGGEALTVNKILWNFFINTMPQQCLAYGPGLISPCYWGLPAKFRIQARDSVRNNRTSGSDQFEVKVRPRLREHKQGGPGSPHSLAESNSMCESDQVEVQIQDMSDGSYEVSYLIQAGGSDFLVDVSLDGISIRGSPWTVEMKDPWDHGFHMLGPSNAPGGIDGMECTVQGSKLVSFGGQSSAVATFDLRHFKWDNPTMGPDLPAPRCGHTMISLDHEKSIVLFGKAHSERENQFFDEIKILSGDKTGWRWTTVNMHPGSDKPTPRSNSAAVLMPGGSRRIFVHGGLDPNGSMLDDSLILKVSTSSKAEWQRLKNIVSFTQLEQFESSQALNDASSPYSSFSFRDSKQNSGCLSRLPGEHSDHLLIAWGKNAVLLFGGLPFSPDVFIGEIKETELTVEWRIASVGGSAPKPRRNCQYVEKDGKVVIYGGYDSTGAVLDDMFLLDMNIDESRWKWECLYMSDAKWISGPKGAASRQCSFGILKRGKLMLLLGSSSEVEPCAEIHVLEYEKLNQSTTIDGKMSEQIVSDIARVKKFLIEELGNIQVENPLAQIEDSSKLLSAEVEARRKTTWQVLASLHRIEEGKSNVELTLDILSEVLALLHPEQKSDGLHQDFDECVDMWREIETLAPEVTKKYQLLRILESDRLRGSLSALEEKATDFDVKMTKQIAFTFILSGADHAFVEIGEMYHELEKLKEESQQLEYEALVLGSGEQIEGPVTRIKTMAESIVGVHQIWCLISLYDSFVNAWGRRRWSELDCQVAKEEFTGLLHQVRSMADAKPFIRDWDLFRDLRLNIQNLLISFDILAGLQSNYVRDRHWDRLRLILVVNSLQINSDAFILKNLLSMDLHTFEDEINELLLRAKSEFEMERILSEIRTLWSNAKFVFEESQTVEARIATLPLHLCQSLDMHRIQISALMSSKFLDAHLRDDPERGVVTFEIEVRHWQSELSAVAEAMQFIDSVQEKWRNLSIFFKHSRDVPKELPEATQKFLMLDQRIRDFMLQFSAQGTCTAACNSEDFVLSFRLESFLRQLENSEEALADYARKKRTACPAFYFLSSSEVLMTLGHRIEETDTHIDFRRIHTGISRINVSVDGGKCRAVSWTSIDETETVPFVEGIELSESMPSNIKDILSEVTFSLYESLKTAVGAIQAEPSLSWLLEYPNQVATCTARIHFSRSMELQLQKYAEGEVDAISKLIKIQQAQLFEGCQMLDSGLSAFQRVKVQSLMLVHSSMHEMSDCFNMEEPGGPESFAWKYQLKVSWQPVAQHSHLFAKQEHAHGDDLFDASFDCFLQCGDAVLQYLHNYNGRMHGIVVTMKSMRVFVHCIQALSSFRGCLIQSLSNAGKTETVRELATLAGTYLQEITCTGQTDSESLVNIFCGLVSNCAWGSFRDVHMLTPVAVSVCANLCKGILQASAERCKTCSIGEIDNIELRSIFGMFVLQTSTMSVQGTALDSNVHEAIKNQVRSVHICEPDLEVFLRVWLTISGFRQPAETSVKIAQIAMFGRTNLTGKEKVDWSLRTFKRLINVSNAARKNTVVHENVEETYDEFDIFEHQLLSHFEPLLDIDSRLLFREFVADIFSKDKELSGNVSKLSSKLAKVKSEDKLKTINAAKLLCTEMAGEQMLVLEELFFHSHAVAITGSPASGKSHLWKGLASVLEERGVKIVWRTLNPKVFSPAQLYGFMQMENQTWTEGLVPILVKDLMGRVDVQCRWLVIDCEIDPTWAEHFQSLLDDKPKLSLANNEQETFVMCACVSIVKVYSESVH